jgi:transposase
VSGQGQVEVKAVVGGGERTKPRRRFAVAEKVRIVEASLAPNASVAGIALAHGVNTNLVFKWRRAYQKGLLGRRRPLARLMPVEIAGQPATSVALAEPEHTAERHNVQTPAPRTSAPGAIHIQLPHAQVRIEGSADEATVRAVLELLRG